MSTVTDERLRELADIAGRWAEERALSPESRAAYLDMQQALRELPKRLRDVEVLNAERERQVEQMREALDILKGLVAAWGQADGGAYDRHTILMPAFDEAEAYLAALKPAEASHD